MCLVAAFMLAAALGSDGHASLQEDDLARTIERYESCKNLRIENRIPTILAFGKVEGPGAVRFLDKIFREELLPEGKKAAIQALVKIDSAAATDLLVQIGSHWEFESDVVDGLGGSSSEEVRDVIYARAKGKGAASLEERIVALRVITRYGDERAEEAILKATRDRRPQIRGAAARCLTSFDGEAALDALAGLLSSKEAREVQIQVIEALQKRKGEIPKKVLKTALSSKVWEVRAGALAVLYGRTDDWTFQETKDLLLSDKDWHVRTEAIKVLTRFREKRCIPPLIEALGKEKGRMLEDVRRGLEELTGLKMAARPEDWEIWWKANKETFRIRDASGEVVEEPERHEAEQGTITTYFGKVIRSKKVIFLIDYSQSMKELYFPPGTKETKVKEDDEEKVRKIDMARKELKKAIEQLKPDVHFNIFFFTGFPQPWKESMVKATPKHREEAIAFLEKGKPAGLTNIFDTLERALGDKKVDTIYLLTDGVPTAGKHKHPRLNEFKMALTELNQHRRVAINTISFGDQTQAYRWFLEALAEENFGEYLMR